MLLGRLHGNATRTIAAAYTPVSASVHIFECIFLFVVCTVSLGYCISILSVFAYIKVSCYLKTMPANVCLPILFVLLSTSKRMLSFTICDCLLYIHSIVSREFVV